MNFIAKNIHIVGLLLLTAFVATAAAMYLEPPAKLSRRPEASVAPKYSCPMHPDVVSQRPGDCPKCGMALTQQSVENNQHKGCNHGMTDVATEPAGCAHAASSGGCCSTSAQLATNSLPPSGCTRSLYPQSETAAP